MANGYTPIGKLDTSNPPQGGSGVGTQDDKFDQVLLKLDKIITILTELELELAQVLNINEEINDD